MISSECANFTELKNSKAVDVRSGCIAIITRSQDGNCIDNSGAIMKFCPYCGVKIVSKYDESKGYWDWWHE